MQDKIKMLLFVAIVLTAMGIYKTGKATYVALAWEKTEGTVVDTPRHTWRCGKGVSECYTINVGFYANNNFITVDSEKTFTNAPGHLLDEKVTVYYSAEDPFNAELGGEYGSKTAGIIFLIVGILLFFAWKFMKKSN